MIPVCQAPFLFKRLAAFVLLSWGLPGLSWGQARREVIVDLPEDVVWYDDVETAVQAQRNGAVVLALDLSRQRLKDLPPDLMLLEDLTYLLASRNRLDHFPDWLADMTDLKAVVADHNRFRNFPEVLFRMPHLTQISMGDNELQGIPLDIDLIADLEVLSLWSNLLASFPASLGNLERLQILDLLHNEMTVEEQGMITALLPDVQLNFSEPCDCDFDTGFQSYPSE